MSFIKALRPINHRLAPRVQKRFHHPYDLAVWDSHGRRVPSYTTQHKVPEQTLKALEARHSFVNVRQLGPPNLYAGSMLLWYGLIATVVYAFGVDEKRQVSWIWKEYNTRGKVYIDPATRTFD